MDPRQHPDQEELLRLLHDELPIARRAVVRDHLAGCASCQGTVDGLTREEAAVDAALATLDHRRPAVTAARIIARAQPRPVSRYRWAAMIVFALGAAGVASAWPGSPVRGWLERLLGTARPTSPQVAPPMTPPAVSPAPTLTGLSIAVEPSLTVRFATIEPGSAVQVLLTDEPEARVEGPPEGTTFTAGPREVRVTATAAGVFRVTVPRIASHLEILLDGRVAFRKVGPTITAPGADSSDGYRLAMPRR